MITIYIMYTYVYHEHNTCIIKHIRVCACVCVCIHIYCANGQFTKKKILSGPFIEGIIL